MSAKAAQIRQLIMARKLTEACQEVEPLLRVSPKDPELLSLAARARLELGHLPQCIALATRALAAGPHPEPLMLRGDAYRANGQTDEAVADFARAAQLAPQSAELRVALAAAHEEAGRVPEARAALDQAINMYRTAGAPLPPKCAYEQAKLLIREDKFAEAIAAIDAVLPQVPAGSIPSQMLLFTRAKACDRVGKFADAWESAKRAHSAAQAAAAANTGRAPWNPGIISNRTDDTIKFWTRERLRDMPSSDLTDPTAIFIAGMPRSGTSLVDQLIHAHPQGAGVGELDTLEAFAAKADDAIVHKQATPTAAQYQQAARDYLRYVKSLAPKAERIVNKALGNAYMVGHLSRLFPATRIVHVVRDPRDVAVSCVLGAFNSGRTPWIARPEWVAHAWSESERLMNHWHDVLEIPILRVRYEELVSGGAPQVQRIIQFLGLPWDESVMNFHQARRTVRTLSYDQVSRPLYVGSVGRWQNYGEQLSHVRWPV